MTYGAKRFGNYHLDLKRQPEPRVKKSQFRDAAKRARVSSAFLWQRGQRSRHKRYSSAAGMFARPA